MLCKSEKERRALRLQIIYARRTVFINQKLDVLEVIYCGHVSAGGLLWFSCRWSSGLTNVTLHVDYVLTISLACSLSCNVVRINNLYRPCICLVIIPFPEFPVPAVPSISIGYCTSTNTGLKVVRTLIFLRYWGDLPISSLRLLVIVVQDDLLQLPLSYSLITALLPLIGLGFNALGLWNTRRETCSAQKALGNASKYENSLYFPLPVVGIALSLGHTLDANNFQNRTTTVGNPRYTQVRCAPHDGFIPPLVAYVEQA